MQSFTSAHSMLQRMQMFALLAVFALSVQGTGLLWLVLLLLLLLLLLRIDGAGIPEGRSIRSIRIDRLAGLP